ncbi:MAG: hypothetical protein EZS28_042934, partial [Streblomastix strix]
MQSEVQKQLQARQCAIFQILFQLQQEEELFHELHHLQSVERYLPSDKPSDGILDGSAYSS